MIEKKIYLEGIDPVKLFGVNNSRYEKIIKLFPKIKVVARGDELKVQGEEKEIASFELKIQLLINYIQNTDEIDDDQIALLMDQDPSEIPDFKAPINNVLLYGDNGKPIRAKTVNQKKLVDECIHNDLVFAIGLAGTGKTYTAIALAVRALKYKEVKRIILTRPAVEAGERLGFLPGDYKEKLDPYLQPLYDALDDMIPSKKLKTFLEDNTIQIAPLAFMRGRTLDNAFVILDEAQNATVNQLKMFLTRMGKNAKFIVTGDITQIDLPKRDDSGLLKAIDILGDIEGISIVYFDGRDIIRHKLVKYIVEAYKKKET
ncbi:MAG: phosphate starvation-inducible protein PhoH [Bacteroides sp. SM23_62_1]|nr:MAG: phosphate starvation-inducible protein PhoH [Bacteroides sp. SM23_62_1]